MGIFEKFGREVEKFKQTAVETAESEATHRCVDCGEPYYSPREACEECGGVVETVETDGDADAVQRGEPDSDADAE